MQEIIAVCLILIKFNICWMPTWIMWLGGQILKMTGEGDSLVPSEYALPVSLANGWWHDMVALWNALLLLVIVSSKISFL